MANKSKEQGESSDQEQRPPQHQANQPGEQRPMIPPPVSLQPDSKGSGRLAGKVALVTGGDSGIGRAIALTFAREGADVLIVYLDEHEDANDTARLVREMGVGCEIFATDIGIEKNCVQAVSEAIRCFGKLDILINNAAEQHPRETLTEIDEQTLVNTFRTNVFSMFFLTKAALPHLKAAKGTIVNTTSVTAYRGSPALVDYSATKGAIVSFTRSLSQQLAGDGIRVNAVAPGPIWTPLIPATFPEDKVASFGSDSPLGRAGEPWECAECFLFLASDDASYMTGQVMHPNGGEIING